MIERTFSDSEFVDLVDGTRSDLIWEFRFKRSYSKQTADRIKQMFGELYCFNANDIGSITFTEDIGPSREPHTVGFDLALAGQDFTMIVTPGRNAVISDIIKRSPDYSFGKSSAEYWLFYFDVSNTGLGYDARLHNFTDSADLRERHSVKELRRQLDAYKRLENQLTNKS